MQSSIVIEFTKTHNKQFLLLVVCLFYFLPYKAQRIGNYVANGSFEEYYVCGTGQNYGLVNAKHWLGTDSLSTAGLYFAVCNSKIPVYMGRHQYPKTGNAYILSTLYYPAGGIHQITYMKNRLKSNLQAGHKYCFTFYVNIDDVCTYAIDGFGAFFGDNNIDTISYCNVPLTYLTPQVQNPYGNIITDTTNWTLITGTFTANGTEKFLLLGNFLSNNNLSTQLINPTNLPVTWADVNIDDVSCIEVDLPAYAGRDTTILIGDSAYIGREPDFAIDSGCVWYQLPDMTTAIDTISGMWVKPPVTTTYVVRQELECSTVKWDTVVVGVGYVGLNEFTIDNLQFTIYPNPANNLITVKSNNVSEELFISIADVTGRIVAEQKVQIQNFSVDVNLHLANGAYLLNISDGKRRAVTKKLLIAK